MKMENGNGIENEKKNLSNFFIVFACAILFFCCGYFTAFFHNRAQSVATRNQLAELEKRELSVRAAVTEFTRRSEQLYEGSFDNIAEIRQAIALLQSIYADFIRDIDYISDDTDCNELH